MHANQAITCKISCVSGLLKYVEVSCVSISMDAHQRTSLRRGSGLDFYLFDHSRCKVRQLLTSGKQEAKEPGNLGIGVSHKQYTVFDTIQKFGYMKRVHSPVGRRSSDSFILVIEKVG